MPNDARLRKVWDNLPNGAKVGLGAALVFLLAATAVAIGSSHDPTPTPDAPTTVVDATRGIPLPVSSTTTSTTTSTPPSAPPQASGLLRMHRCAPRRQSNGKTVDP
jgi:hypothetical protein